MRVYNKNSSRLLKGVEKVIDRQNAKPRVSKIDFGMNTYTTYKNKYASETNLSGYYFPLKWQPLRYVIKAVAHTTYTYCISSSPIGQNTRKRLKNRFGSFNK